MSRVELDPEVREFLRAHLRSYEQLEILLALRGAPRNWSLGELALDLGIDDAPASVALETLREAGLVKAWTVAGARTFSYVARSTTADHILALIARERQERPAALLRVMSEQALERLRTSAAQAFADAFVLRKDKSDG
ncbi:MAG: helix-turn-helix domain-containing protein [Proteobacteria bacterium]|nr:helix-turn-helix domain-containing protein [Pseudomonadota bacterium]